MLRVLFYSLVDAFYGTLHISPNSRFLSEPFCECCGQPFEGEAFYTQTCPNCRDVKWKFRQARALYRMEGDVREFIHAFKYHRENWLRCLLGEWMYQAYQVYYEKNPYKAIVPVPLSHARLRQRGYNQARELATYLARRCGIPMWDCLRRRRDNPSQAGLTRAMRLRNVRRLFELKEQFFPLSGEYLLVDDVLTTGSTCSACADVLLQAGASAVDVITAARG